MIKWSVLQKAWQSLMCVFLITGKQNTGQQKKMLNLKEETDKYIIIFGDVNNSLLVIGKPSKRPSWWGWSRRMKKPAQD